MVAIGTEIRLVKTALIPLPTMRVCETEASGETLSELRRWPLTSQRMNGSLIWDYIANSFPLLADFISLGIYTQSRLTLSYYELFSFRNILIAALLG